MILIVKVREDLSGRRYGNLTVIKQTEDGVIAGKNVPMWLCRCDCGKIKSVLGDSLKRGKAVSCGCRKVSKKSQINRYDFTNPEYAIL